MRLAFDGKRAALNSTGLGNYSRLVIEAMARADASSTCLVYTPNLVANSRLLPLMLQQNVEFKLPPKPLTGLRAALWRSRAIPDLLFRDRATLYHGLAGELPQNISQAKIPSVVTVHDLIFRHFPKTYSPIDRHIYDTKARQACRDASRVIAISEATKRDIVAAYGTDPEKIDVVYQGCADQFRHPVAPRQIEEAKQKYGLDRPYIISVGTIETRKNQQMAIRGMVGVSDEFDLVLVGRRTPYAKTLDRFIASRSMEPRVKFIESADFADLPALYAGAFCSSYTSRCEGFGLPVIESLSVGTPVVIASGTCLEEAAGPDAPTVEPDDIDSWIREVREMYDYPERRASLAEKGRRYVARFSPEAMTAAIHATYEKALR